MPQATKLQALAVLLPGLACGCQYDLDKIYENESDSADAGGDGDELPDPLIGLWDGKPLVDADCASCARSECSQQNAACLADPECAKLTQCVARSADPSTIDDCRSEQVPWLTENLTARPLGGPYYACVFRDQCADQCATHTDTSCLGSYAWSRATTTTVPVTFQFVDALTPDEGASGLSVKVCRGDDVDCVSAGAPATTDAAGQVALTLPAPLRTFDGYLDVTGGDWYPTLVKLGYPVARPAAVLMPIVDEQSIALQIQSSGVEPDPTRGQLQMRMFGCAGVGMRGVSFEASANLVDDATRTWYVTSGFPNFDAVATNDLGSGGIINVKRGFADITARLAADGTVIARARAPVRAGYLTIVVLAPLDSSQ
jgi:hypothetical protein